MVDDIVDAPVVTPDELVGDRIVVRAWRSGDAEALFEAIDESRDHLRPWMMWVDHHRTIADSEDYCERVADGWARRIDFPLGIWERATGRLLGGSGYHNIDWDVPSFEIGYWIRASAEGRGYVTEAARLQTRFAFERMGANRVVIQCDADNVRSAGVPQRLGFVQEARLRNHQRKFDGGLRDTLVFAMTPDDYRVLRLA
jgi:ribosomal-protein-serine acetyltransferase